MEKHIMASWKDGKLRHSRQRESKCEKNVELSTEIVPTNEIPGSENSFSGRQSSETENSKLAKKYSKYELITST